MKSNKGGLTADNSAKFIAPHYNSSQHFADMKIISGKKSMLVNYKKQDYFSVITRFCGAGGRES